jgi:hypothetical protein
MPNLCVDHDEVAMSRISFMPLTRTQRKRSMIKGFHDGAHDIQTL